MKQRIYLDSSAYISLLLNESGANEIARAIAGGEVLSSVLLVLEARRNLIRLSREGTLSAQQLHHCVSRLDEDIEEFTIRDLTIDLCSGFFMPAVSTPRTLDLAHLRTAMWFHQQESITRFISLDHAQVQAARELGLPT